MFLHNLSQRHVSALSRAILRLNTCLCEVNHTIDNVMILLLRAVLWSLVGINVASFMCSIFREFVV